MSYRDQFDETINAVLDGSEVSIPPGRDLWPERLSEEGVEYGLEASLPAGEAAAWYLSAAALIRMCDGQLGVPLASALLRSARSLARTRGMGADLREALDRMEQERFDWILANHERQGAGLRALRPVDPGLDLDADFVPPPDWPAVLEELLQDTPRHAE